MMASFFARGLSRGMAWSAATVLACLAVAVGCATSGSSANDEAFYASCGSASIDSKLPRDRRRRAALDKAELNARDQVLKKVLHLRLADGRVVGDMAAADPFARAVVMDAVRAASIKDRVANEDSGASVTVRLELAPVRSMLGERPARAAR
jgi:hypothetical protein